MQNQKVDRPAEGEERHLVVPLAGRGTPGLSIRARLRDGVPVLTLSGRLDGRGVDVLEAMLTEFLASDQSRVPCDVSELDYLSPQAVQKLVHVAAARPPRPAAVVLCGASSQPQQVLADMDAGRTLPLYRSVAEAIDDSPGAMWWSQLTLTCDLAAPGWARAFLARVCTDWQLEAVVEEARLLVSELVTNAVVHAGGAAEVTLQRLGDQLTIAVRDGADVPPVHRDADLMEEGGRGLHLVEALSTADGTYPRPEGGKVVWCTVHLPDS
ncbi:MAG TPA: ATP-binding protein [Actinomycetales bacterium]|nr:ATP-binding protein [Actinomycetales bacterium]